MTDDRTLCPAMSKTTGKRCRRLAHPGEAFCYLHGGHSFYEILTDSPRHSAKPVDIDDAWARLQREDPS